MVPGLIVAGYALQLIGLVLVFAEIASIRAHDFGVLPPWTRLWRVARRVLRRSTTYTDRATGAFRVAGTLRARGRVRPGGVGDTESERLERLERYVKAVDDELEQVWDALEAARAAAAAQDEEREHRIHEAIEAREQERRARLRWSIRRQVVGETFVAVGLVLGMIGTIVN